MYVRIVADKQPKGFGTPDELQRRLESVLEVAAQRTVFKLKVYPPPPAGSRYRRTGRLRDEWRYFRSVAGGEIAFTLVNEAREDGRLYSSFVQGRKQTAIMKNIGWITADEMLDRERIAKDVQDEITRFLRG